MKIGPLQPKSWPATCGTTTSSKQSDFSISQLNTKLRPINRPTEATEIFFMGIGNAFYGIANLLINRGAPNASWSQGNR